LDVKTAVPLDVEVLTVFHANENESCAVECLMHCDSFASLDIDPENFECVAPIVA
jgi:hypothetical protein